MSTILGQPSISEVVLGKHTLNLYGLQNAAAAAPVTLTQVRGIQEVSLDPNISTEKIFHQGGGDEALDYPMEIEWSGQLTMLGGLIDTNLNAMLGLSLGTSQYAMPLRSTRQPVGFIQRKVYQKDSVTIIGSWLIPDVIIGDIPVSGALDRADLNIPIYSYWSPYWIDGAADVVYDVWTVSAATYTPSSTPIAIQAAITGPNNELVTQYDFFVKHWATGATLGTRCNANVNPYTQTPATPVLTFTTTPAAGKVSMLYLAAV